MQKLIETYTVQEVAKALKLHPYTVRRLSREEKVPAFKFGGQWRYDRLKISSFMERKKGVK